MDLALFFRLSPDALFVGDFLGRIKEVNEAAARQQGQTREELIGRSFVSLAHPGDLPRVAAELARLAMGSTTVSFETRVRMADGSFHWFLWSATPVLKQGLFYAIGKDITAAKDAEAERERLVAELQEALAQAKTLRGLLPICSYCKRIRDDDGAWQAMESYIHERSDAKFSHDICDDCLREHFAEFREPDGG